jgi:thioredoxin reductase (NADPH)
MADAKPVLLAVDDDLEVSRAVERDLRSRYAESFHVLSADSGSAALDLLRRMVVRGETPALLLADQRMPGMTGVEFLAAAVEFAPGAKRVLLTAYADTDAAIRAINEIRLDHYLMKPWHPPEERLYPVLDDLLDDWRASSILTEDSVRLIGHRWSVESQRTRELLVRNFVPHRWLDAEQEEGRRLLAAAGLGVDQLPVLVFADGSTLTSPSQTEVADRVGLRTRAEHPFYDLVIAGGGPAGLAAAVYGASEGLRTVIIELEASGGQAGQSSRIENYLGFPSGLSGSDLARRATAQARRFGAEILTAQEATALDARGAARIVRLSDGSELACHAVLIATGVSYRRLEAPGVEELTGRGVYYGAAAAAEAALYADRSVVVVGGANSAGQAALHLARAARVTVVCRGASLERSMSRYLVERIEASPEIGVRLNANVVEAHGDEHLEAITLDEAGNRSLLDADAAFVFIGAEPHTDWLGGLIARTERGFILAGPQVLQSRPGAPQWPLRRDPLLLETNVPGVFVAGDVREQSIKRVASAVGEGSMAVLLVHQYLREL